MLIIGGLAKKTGGLVIGGNPGQTERPPEFPALVVSDDRDQDVVPAVDPHAQTDEYEAWMADQEQRLSALAAPQKQRYAHWYPGVGNSDVHVVFEVVDSYELDEPKTDERGQRCRNGDTVRKTYQILCADLQVPQSVVDDYGQDPFSHVNCRVYVNTHMNQIYVIEVYYGGVYVGYCRLFAPYNWAIQVADPCQISSSSKLYPGAKLTGWVYNFHHAGVPREQMLDPLVPWPAINSLLHYVVNNRRDLTK